MAKFLSSAPLVGVSSWALHRELGAPPISGAESGAAIPFSLPTGALPLLELPAELTKRGFDSLQICHFHLPSHENGYLDELRGAIEGSHLPLHALLVDEGDITHPENGQRDEEWIRGWIPLAARLGAQHIRVIAGKTSRAGALDHSTQVLSSLADQAQEQGLALLIENWFDLLSTPAAIHELLERCEGKVKFLLDFGNWSGATKYEHLAQIAPFASSCHAQASFLDANHFDEEDYSRCLNLPYPDDFNGPFVLVNGGMEGISALRDFIKSEPEIWAQ